MFKTTSGFFYVIFILIACFALVRLFYYFKFKRDTLSDFDKSLWRLKFVSVFFAVLMYVSVLHLPAGFYTLIDVGTSSQDATLRQLVRNQEEIGEDLRQLRDICYFILMITASYVVAVATIISKLQKERRKNAVKDDPTLKKPLGL